MQATAKTTSVEQGEENLPDEDDEEEREVNLKYPSALWEFFLKCFPSYFFTVLKFCINIRF